MAVYVPISTNRTFMELKLPYYSVCAYLIYSTNRTFMELKYMWSNLGLKDLTYQSNLYGIEISVG